jgi:hypothetical protein
VIAWLARRLGAPKPPVQSVDPGGGGEPRVAHATGKRCRNARLLASGYRFIYPTFREGYEDVLRGPRS